MVALHRSRDFRRITRFVLISTMLLVLLLGVPNVGTHPVAASQIACNQSALTTAYSVDSAVIELPAGCTITLTGTPAYDSMGPTWLPPITRGSVTIFGNDQPEAAGG